MTRDITISIINYKTAQMTIDCANSVLEDLGTREAQIVIVDNASGDGSEQIIGDWIASLPDPSRVTLVSSPTNSGFSGGHNQGISACEARFYLILNSDALVRSGFFDAILTRAENAPDAGMVVPRLEGEDAVAQVNCFRFPSPASEFIRSACTGIVTHLLKRHEVALDPDPDEGDIGWGSFACILLRHDMVAKIGPMDEGYFLYFEDADYCLRARRAGWKIVRAPKARAVHFRGGSGPVKTLASQKKRLPPYYYASRTRFFRKAHGPAGPFLANMAWYSGRLLAQLRRLVGREVYPLPAHESRDIWINATAPLGPRRAPGE